MSEASVWFIPQGDYDPERPTLANLANAKNISNAIRWEPTPITLTYFKEDNMTELKFKVGDRVRLSNASLTNLNGRSGSVIKTSTVNNSYDYFIKLDFNNMEYWVFENELQREDAINEPTEDVVNHPTHYTSDPSGVECIQITRHRNFNVGNAIKYLWRAGLKVMLGEDAKKKQIEDLKKAIFYINDEIERLENE